MKKSIFNTSEIMRSLGYHFAAKVPNKVQLFLNKNEKEFRKQLEHLKLKHDGKS